MGRRTMMKIDRPHGKASVGAEAPTEGNCPRLPSRKSYYDLSVKNPNRTRGGRGDQKPPVSLKATKACSLIATKAFSLKAIPLAPTSIRCLSNTPLGLAPTSIRCLSNTPFGKPLAPTEGTPSLSLAPSSPSNTQFGKTLEPNEPGLAPRLDPTSSREMPLLVHRKPDARKSYLEALIGKPTEPTELACTKLAKDEARKRAPLRALNLKSANRTCEFITEDRKFSSSEQIVAKKRANSGTQIRKSTSRTPQMSQTSHMRAQKSKLKRTEIKIKHTHQVQAPTDIQETKPKLALLAKLKLKSVSRTHEPDPHQAQAPTDIQKTKPESAILAKLKLDLVNRTHELALDLAQAHTGIQETKPESAL